MKFSRHQVIKFCAMLVFFCCMLFANFAAVRMILRAGVDIYFYDKLQVAYNVGGQAGLKLELSKIPLTDKLPREAMLARDFSAGLADLADPGAFLKDKVQENKQKVFLIRNLRSVAVLIMIILFSWQLWVKSAAKKRKEPPGV